MALGYDDGRVIVNSLKDGAESEVASADRASPVSRLLFSSAGVLAIGHRGGVRLVGLPKKPIAGPGDADGRPISDLLDRPAEHIVFSPGGEYLAACTEEIGAVKVWRIGGDGTPAVLRDDPSARAFRLGITGNGRGMAVADFAGGLEFTPFNPQGDEAAWGFPAHRGKIQGLSATPDRQLLLFLDEQRGVRIWDLKERTCRRLDGTYRAGAFLDDARLVLIPDSNAADHAGRLVLADRSGGRVASPSFAVKADKFTIPDGIPFERLAVSEDGAGRRGVRLRQGSVGLRLGDEARAIDALDHHRPVGRPRARPGLLRRWPLPADRRRVAIGSDLGSLGIEGRAGRPGRDPLGPDADEDHHLRRDPSRTRRTGSHRPQRRPGPRLEVGPRSRRGGPGCPPSGRPRVFHRGQGALLHGRRPIPGRIRRRETHLGRRHGTASAPGRPARPARPSS